MWKSWLNGILGLVIIVAAFMGLTGATLTWTLVVLGVLVAILSFWSAVADGDSNSMRQPAFR
jgi:hypothetical protein